MGSHTESVFHPFAGTEQNAALPVLFTCPFCYTPHPLAQKAAAEVIKYVSGKTEWQAELQSGKMFGVLAVLSAAGELGFLAAFSGNIAKQGTHPYFVPPIYDLTNPDGYFKAEEQRITEINTLIDSIESDESLIKLKDEIEHCNIQSNTEICLFKSTINEHKRERDRLRTAGVSSEQNEGLVRQSQFEKAELKRIERRWAETISSLEDKKSVFDKRLADLKRQRKQMSEALQYWIFDQYVLLNAKGETKTVNQIFAESRGTVPPSAAGECAAPKMLQFALKHNFKPLAMAEFWWGDSPSGEIRRHGQYYPACHSKCEPILNFILQGISVEPNPLKTAVTRPLKILFEDEWLLAVDKPEGMLSVPGKESDDSIYAQIKKSYPDADGPLVVHRLDMSTSGILLIAKTKKVHELLQRQFAEHKIKKRYVALLQGCPSKQSGTVCLPLCSNPDDRPRQMVDFKLGKHAVTQYEVTESDGKTTRVNFYPQTGRTHQLRVHSSHPQGLNCPIIGDNLYGSHAERLYLHATELEFLHPVTNKTVNILSEPDF